jgi:hypothetical protein
VTRSKEEGDLVLAVTHAIADRALEQLDWRSNKLEHAVHLAAATLEVLPELGWLSPADQREIMHFAGYTVQYEIDEAGRKRAMRLLHQVLTPRQKYELRKTRMFTVTGTAGGRYRLHPGSGQIHRLAPRGPLGREYQTHSFCLHERGGLNAPAFPGPDRSLAHLLLLRTDEPTFLAEAHAVPDPPWRNRLNRRRTQADVERMQVLDGFLAEERAELERAMNEGRVFACRTGDVDQPWELEVEEWVEQSPVPVIHIPAARPQEAAAWT